MVKNKNIVITGVLGLLGKSLTSELAENGANIIMLDIKNKDELRKISSFHSIKQKINYIKCDVTNIKNVKKIDNLFKNNFRKIV